MTEIATKDPLDYTDEELGLNDVPFFEATTRLAEAGRLIEAEKLSEAVYELGAALHDTIVEATTIIDGLNERIAELEALVATSS